MAKIWLNGPNRGKEVSQTPIKIRQGDSLKLDNEANLTEHQLSAMQDKEWLLKQSKFFGHMHTATTSFYDAAVMADEDPRLLANQRPPSRWPLRLLVGAMLVLVALVCGLSWRVMILSTRSTLPSRDANAAQYLPQERSDALPASQGGVVVAKRLRLRTGGE